MTLLDEARSASSRPLACGLAAFRLTLTDAERDELDTAITDGGITATAIWRVLQRRGWSKGPDVVRRHRQGVCSCGPR